MNNSEKINKEYKSFAEFYPFYLTQHQNITCRILHYIGSLLALALTFTAIYTQNLLLLPVALIAGYFFAWIGHFFFEHNKPATFQYPIWSFMGDWVMLKDFIVKVLLKR